MASKPNFEAATQRTFERFAAVARKAFTDIATALRPAINAVIGLYRHAEANRKIRRAFRLRHWSQAVWYVGNHHQRLASKTRRLECEEAGVVRAEEAAEGG